MKIYITLISVIYKKHEPYLIRLHKQAERSRDKAKATIPVAFSLSLRGCRLYRLPLCLHR